MEPQNNKLSIPAAIVFAGVLIAGAIFLVKMPVSAPVQKVAQKNQDFPIKAISADDHILGNPDASIVVVEYSDFECPFCKNFHTTMQSIMTSYGKEGNVAWIYRQFPLNIHPKAEKEAEASECVSELGGNTGFWKFADEIFSITPSNNQLDPAKLPVIAKDVGVDVAKFTTCLDSGKYAQKIQDEENDGVSAGANGTPYSILVLKSALSSSKVNQLDTYIATQGLQENAFISSDSKKVVLNGALPLVLVQAIVDIILK